MAVLLSIVCGIRTDKTCGVSTLGFLYMALVMSVSMPDAFGLSPSGPESVDLSRRDVLGNAAGRVVTIGSVWLGSSQKAVAVRGAAELDLEYYVKDLIGGNSKEGTVAPSKPPPVAPPRTLGGPLLPLLLDDNFATGTPVLALTELMPRSGWSDTAAKYRERSRNSFGSRYQWDTEHISDQYYFDLTSYALWRTAADVLPDYKTRDKFARNVGRKIFQECQSVGLLSAPNGDIRDHPLTASTKNVLQILELFKSSGFCKSYKIGDSSPADATEKADLFDVFDDEDLTGGASVTCVIGILEPATMAACLQITGEQSRFTPDFVGATLAAMWEAAGISSRHEMYFVDSVYRPNPKDYYPDEQLLQFTLSKATS